MEMAAEALLTLLLGTSEITMRVSQGNKHPATHSSFLPSPASAPYWKSPCEAGGPRSNDVVLTHCPPGQAGKSAKGSGRKWELSSPQTDGRLC